MKYLRPFQAMEPTFFPDAVSTAAKTGKERADQGRRLQEHCGWAFWRFDLSAELAGEPRSLAYSLDMDGCDPAHKCGVLAGF